VSSSLRWSITEKVGIEQVYKWYIQNFINYTCEIKLLNNFYLFCLVSHTLSIEYSPKIILKHFVKCRKLVETCSFGKYVFNSSWHKRTVVESFLSLCFQPVILAEMVHHSTCWCADVVCITINIVNNLKLSYTHLTYLRYTVWNCTNWVLIRYCN